MAVLKKLSAVVLLGVALIENAVMADQTCMYCKRMDTNSGFLYSYNYCPESGYESCVADSWNYINTQCAEPLIEGWQLDIEEDCQASRQICFDFISNKLAEDNPKSTSVDLGINSMCTIMVDATKFVGRITFKDDTNSLGVLYPGYVLGQPITVPEGEVRYITLYNGNQAGVLQFESIFSGAKMNAFIGSFALLSALISYAY